MNINFHSTRLQLEIRDMEKYKNEVTEYRAEVSALQRKIANIKKRHENGSISKIKIFMMFF